MRLLDATSEPDAKTTGALIGARQACEQGSPIGPLPSRSE